MYWHVSLCVHFVMFLRGSADHPMYPFTRRSISSLQGQFNEVKIYLFGKGGL